MSTNFKPLFNESDLEPNANGRWVWCPTDDTVHLMQTTPKGEEIIAILPENTFPTALRLQIRAWVDRGWCGGQRR